MDSNKIFRAAVFIFAISMFVFCAYRAIVLSFTHDEAGSYLFFKDSKVLDYFFQKDLWKSANNHLLNTFLYQQSISWLGDTSFNLRLPNVLAFAIYLSSGICLLFKLYKDYWILSLSMLLLLANPYVFDFFSLSRGYGLMLGFEMLSIYLFYLYISSRHKKYLIFTYLALILMTSAILSSIILIPAFTLALWLYLYQNKSLHRFDLFVPIAFGIASIIIFYVPFTALSALDEFKYGTRSFINVFHYLIEDSLMGRNYFGYYTPYMFSLVIIGVIAFSSYLAIKKRLNDSSIEFPYGYMRFIAFSFLITLLGLLVASIMFGSRFPQHRQSLFMYPFMVLLFSFVFYSFKQLKYIKWSIRIIALIALLHFFVGNRTERTREWWYDFDTKAMLTQIIESHPNESILINVDWHFHPSVTYYLTKAEFKNISVAPYSKTIDVANEYDYYITFEEGLSTLESRYDISYKNNFKVFLLKKK